MRAPVRDPLPRLAASILPLAAACLLVSLVSSSHAQTSRPSAHHPGQWTDTTSWGKISAYDGKQAVHLAVLRGDSLHEHPHSQVLWWGLWDAEFNVGGLRDWNLASDDCAASLDSNLIGRAVARPPYNTFCAGAATLANGGGDLLIMGGHEVNIVGVRNAAIFRTQTRTWDSTGSMARRRWYGDVTMLGGADGKLVATAGLQYHHMLLYGGRASAGDTLRNSLDRYGVTSAGQWDASIPPDPDPNTWPAAREGHSLAVQDKGPYYLFGGRGANGDSLQDDAPWQLRRKDDDAEETYEWVRIDAQAPLLPPRARWRHSAIAVPTSQGDAFATTYVFGGQTPQGAALGDLWKLWWNAGITPHQWQWNKITNAQGTAPSARYGHTAQWIPKLGSMAVFGGKLGDGSVSDTLWLLKINGSSLTWTRPTLEGTAHPSGRWRHAMALDPSLSAPPGHSQEKWIRLFVFGGERSDSLSRELWTLWISPDTTTVLWDNVSYGVGPLPAPRAGASLVYNFDARKVVMFGGETGGSADDRPWAIEPLDGKVWSTLPALGTGVSGHTALFEGRALDSLQPERYDPANGTWSDYGNPKFQFSYHLMFQGPDGKLFSAGPTDQTYRTFRFNPDSGTWMPFPSDTVRFDGGSGVMFRPGKVMKCGVQFSPDTAHGRTAWIDLTQGDNAHWIASADTMLGRRDHNLTMLPTGEVLVTGGTRLPIHDTASVSQPQRQPEIWYPEHTEGSATGWWYGRSGLADTALALEPVERSHHSSASLLPDARVLSAGGWDKHDDTNHAPDVYCPPYLFKRDGGAAFRPRLVGAQDYIKWDQDFVVSCLDTVASACLIRPGMSTHSFNQNQRFVPVTVVSQGGNRVTLHAPANGNLAPPGDYLLFVLRQDESVLVPSIARWVHLGNVQTQYQTCDTLAPQATTLNARLVNPWSLTLYWNAPHEDGTSGGSATRYEIRYRAGQDITSMNDFLDHASPIHHGNPPSGPSAPGNEDSVRVIDLTPNTTYYFRMVSRDDAGSSRNWSPLSNSLQITTPTEEGGGCPFVDTKTASGWQEENSILGRSLTGALSLDDYRIVQAPAVEGGRVRLRIRENEQELTTLDQVRLIALDHDPALEAFSAGERVVLGTPFPAARVTRSDGLDVTASLTGLGRGYFGQPGDTLLVELDATGGGRSRPSGSLGADRTLPGGGGFEDGGGGKGGGGRSRPASATAVDAEVLATSGILIQAPDGAGGWRTVRTHYPREHYDRSLTDSLASGPVRLVFVGSHRLNYVGRVLYSPEELPAQKLALLGAAHNRLGDQRTAVDELGNLTTAIAPGDTLELEFDWPAVPEGRVRDLFLLSRGVYTANLPAQQQGERLPTRFALRQNQPNPFANATTFRFDLPAGSIVKLELFDAQGRRVEMLVNRYYPAGSHNVEWSPGRSGRGIRPGVYFYRIEAGPFRARRKMVLLP